MHELAAVAWPWQRVIDAFEFFPCVRRRIRQREFGRLVAELRARLGLERIDEVWLCWTTRAPEKLILDAYPEARIAVYEDGLFSYLPLPLTPPEPPGARAWLRERLDAWRPVRRFRRYKDWLDPRHAARFSGAWMVLADLAPAPGALSHMPRHAIGDAALRETLDACSRIGAAASMPLAPSERPRVLVLGQSLSRWNAVTRADELALYRSVIGRVLARGYDVWWKEHPRVQQPFFDELNEGREAGRVHRLDLPFALPVELVAGRLDLAACVAGISTALFYLPRLFGTPAYTFADELAPMLSTGWVAWREQNDLVRSRVAPLDALPPASSIAAARPARSCS
nr:alpha-2,8-polysialyltransferase family protein [Schlegelella koreensis]